MTTLPMTEQSVHTPEPWSVEHSTEVYGPNSRHIADCSQSDFTLLMNQANAHRIVACVNACAGIENEELEKLANLKCDLPGVAGLAQMAILSCADRELRDELAKALRELSAASKRARGNGYNSEIGLRAAEDRADKLLATVRT